MKLQLFKIREGKKDQWQDWCIYLDSHQEDAKHTLKEENCTREAFFMHGDYVIGYAEFNDVQLTANMNNPLNIDHRRHLSECLEKVPGFPLYDISTK